VINFKPVKLSDKAWMDKHFIAEDSRCCDFNFTNIFIWGDSYKLTAAEVAGMLVFRTVVNKIIYYSFPIGLGDVRAAVSELLKHCRESKEPFNLRGITEKNAEKIDILFPCLFDFSPERSSFDYVYLAEKLATLSGKRLHAKRNHINKFISSYNWTFEPITAENVALCAAMNEEWIRRNRGAKGSPTLDSEQEALSKALSNYTALGLEGGALFVDGEMVAFTIGEKLNSDTYVVHFEKAFREINGSYSMINREFVRYVMQNHPEIVYINREDDTGAENLRRAKQSYYPEFMVEKYIAVPSKQRSAYDAVSIFSRARQT
jgi:hypothetical protein